MSQRSKTVGFLNLIIEIPAVLVMIVMMLHITANALMRTYFENPIDNTLEIVQYWYLPIVAFLGFITAQARGQHIAADLVFEMLPQVTRKYVLAVVFVVCAVVAFGFARFGWDEAMHAREIKKVAGVSTVISWPTYFLVPLAFGSLTIQFLYAAVRALVKPELDRVVADIDDASVLDAVEEDIHERELTHAHAESAAPAKEER